MRGIAARCLALTCATVVGVVLIGGFGCGDAISSACDAACDCWQCSRAEYEGCLDNVEDAVRRAERQGCPEAVDAFVRCAHESLECSGELDAPEPTLCRTEREGLARCGVAVPALGPTCERGAQRMLECQGTSIDPTLCEFSSRCWIACYATASCAEVRSGFSPQLTDCIAACSAEAEP